jgi:TetR/AcrR family transcriptional repressor of nem operon
MSVVTRFLRSLLKGRSRVSFERDLEADDLAAFLIDSYEGAILRMRVERNPTTLKFFIKVVFSSILA